MKTYFVPLDDEFNLVKQNMCKLDYMSSNEKGRAFKARTTLLSGVSGETGIFESTSQNSAVDIGEVTSDYETDDIKSLRRLHRSISELVDIENCTPLSQRDNLSDTCLETDILETRC